MEFRNSRWIVLISALATTVPAGAAHPPLAPPPPAATTEVVDTYHSVKVADPYRWLEDTADPKVKQWSGAQNRRARAYLDALPYRKPMYERFMKQASAASSAFSDLRVVGDQCSRASTSLRNSNRWLRCSGARWTRPPCR